jgi:hypothetical protein
MDGNLQLGLLLGDSRFQPPSPGGRQPQVRKPLVADAEKHQVWRHRGQCRKETAERRDQVDHDGQAHQRDPQRNGTP